MEEGKKFPPCKSGHTSSLKCRRVGVDDTYLCKLDMVDTRGGK
jgi:hypothetical protein